MTITETINTVHSFHYAHDYRGAEVYDWYTNHTSPCPVHAGVMIWVDMCFSSFTGRTRSSVTSLSGLRTVNRVTFLSARPNTTYIPNTADLNITACTHGKFKQIWGKSTSVSWGTPADCSPGQGLTPPTISRDSICEKCLPGHYNSKYDTSPCAPVPTCPTLNISGPSSNVTYNFSTFVEVSSLTCGPRYSRNSSALLLCSPGGTWKAVVAFGILAIDVDLTVRQTIGQAASYKLFGRTFIATETAANGYTFLTVNTTLYGGAYAGFNTHVCLYGFLKAASGNAVDCVQWSTAAGCPVGQGFIPGNITHDAKFSACVGRTYSDNYDMQGCLSYPTCPTFTSTLGAAVITLHKSSVAQFAGLLNGCCVLVYCMYFVLCSLCFVLCLLCVCCICCVVCAVCCVLCAVCCVMCDV